MIPRKMKPCKCGCGHEGIIWSKGMLQPCYYMVNPKKPLQRTGIKVKVSKKKQERIRESKVYYRQAIGKNIIKNKGACRCDECGDPIKKPTGRNVCHIIGGGANEALYLEPENHFILGKGELFGECNCGWRFDESGEQATMEIVPMAEQIKERLNAKYYK